MQRPKPPHIALMETCREIAGEAVWALGMGVDNFGQRQWEIYCEDKELAKMLPEEYGGNPIHVIVAIRPTQEQIAEAKRQEEETKRKEKGWLQNMKNIWSPKKKKKQRN